MSFYSKIYSDFKTEYLMHATLGIILSSCLGAAAAMMVLMNGNGFLEMFQLFILVVVCMGFNATVLANLNTKVIFNWLLVSLLASVATIILHLI
jgi:hypothetical protein